MIDRRRLTRGILLLLPVLLVAAAGIAHAQSVSIADAEPVVEGETMEFLVSLSQASDEEIRVPWLGVGYYVAGDADSGRQERCPEGPPGGPADGTVIFPPGSTKQMIRFVTCQDDRDERKN